VQRWVANGVPHTKVWELTIRFRGDPIAAFMVLGYVDEDDVPNFDFAAVVEYIPTSVLTDEVNRRAHGAAQKHFIAPKRRAAI